MDENATCRWVQDRLAGYCEGWDGCRERESIDAHLAICPACAAERKRDESLLRTLAEMPQEMPPPITWGQVYASRRQERRLSGYAGKPVAAFAVAALSLLLAALSYHGGWRAVLEQESPLVAAPRIAAPPRDTSGYEDAHLLASVGGFAGDPNRVVVLTRMAPQGSGTIR